jgi:hypothetical protein
MWINLDEPLDLPKVTVVNYEEIEGVLFWLYQTCEAKI